MTDTPIITIYSILEDSNRLSSVDDIVFQYDANGNITNDGEHDYHYDARNRLSQVDERTINISITPAICVYKR